MNEDLKPVLDIEDDWSLCSQAPNKKYIYFNKNYESLYRVVDVEKELVTFTDSKRIEKIVDINKVLTKSDSQLKNMACYLGLANRVLDEVRPISMPYVPEHLNAYIEAFPGFNDVDDDALGILYFWNKPSSEEIKEEGVLDAEMIPGKKFFRIHPKGTGIHYEEIDIITYNDAKTKWMRREEEKLNVDKA